MPFFWSVFLLLALMSGIMGWIGAWFVTVVLWLSDVREGEPVNWGWNVATTIAVPFTWIFSIMEIIIVYSR